MRDEKSAAHDTCNLTLTMLLCVTFTLMMSTLTVLHYMLVPAVAEYKAR